MNKGKVGDGQEQGCRGEATVQANLENLKGDKWEKGGGSNLHPTNHWTKGCQEKGKRRP